MVFLSKFAETLDTLMFERELTYEQVAEIIGVDKTTAGRYLHAQIAPTVEHLVKLANFFQCSTDFLLGRENENYTVMFQPCPPFPEQLKILKERFGCPWCHFYKIAHISRSRFYEWKNGKRKPSLDCIISLADGFDCTVDLIIGRTKN